MLSRQRDCYFESISDQGPAIDLFVATVNLLRPPPGTESVKTRREKISLAGTCGRQKQKARHSRAF
jgi:hypothetical protein